jgi:hypothetical protein
MFTDVNTSPRQMIGVLDCVMGYFPKAVKKEVIAGLMTPLEPYSNLDECLSGLRLLNLLDLGSDGYVTHTNQGDSSDLIVEAMDDLLCSNREDGERWFGRFQSYLMRRGPITPGTDRDKIISAFREGLPEEFRNDGPRSSNPMNKTKLPGWFRWAEWYGYGWTAPDGTWIPDMSTKISRAILKFWSANSGPMPGDTFLRRIAELCPEVDGGIYDRERNEKAGLGTNLGASYANSLVSLWESGVLDITINDDDPQLPSLGLAHPKANGLPGERMRSVVYLGGAP